MNNIYHLYEFTHAIEYLERFMHAMQIFANNEIKNCAFYKWKWIKIPLTLRVSTSNECERFYI